MKQKVTVKVEKQPGERNFACYVVEDTPGFFLTGFGYSAKKAIEDLYVAEEEIRESLEEEGKEMPEFEFTLKFDIGSFFNYFNYLNIDGVAKKAGIKPSVMRQYVTDNRCPKEKTRQKIENCLHEIGKELQAVALY